MVVVVVKIIDKKSLKFDYQLVLCLSSQMAKLHSRRTLPSILALGSSLKFLK